MLKKCISLQWAILFCVIGKLICRQDDEVQCLYLDPASDFGPEIPPIVQSLDYNLSIKIGSFILQSSILVCVPQVWYHFWKGAVALSIDWTLPYFMASSVVHWKWHICIIVNVLVRCSSYTEIWLLNEHERSVCSVAYFYHVHYPAEPHHFIDIYVIAIHRGWNYMLLKQHEMWDEHGKLHARFLQSSSVCCKHLAVVMHITDYIPYLPW